MSGRDDVLGVLSEAAWRRRALNATGSVLAFCEVVVGRSEFAMSGTSKAVWESRASNGHGQCWFSLRRLCRGSSAAA